MVNHLYPCVIPTIPVDYERTKLHFDSFFELLPICKIVFIGPEELREYIDKDCSDKYADRADKIEFICENELIPFDIVRRMYDEIKQSSKESNASAIGWYYQQFLKMAYAFVCDMDYYLCWDSDTLPLKKIEMFNVDGKPYFDVKRENNAGYFRIIRKLLGYNKIIAKSFVSEHMIFNKAFMLEMIVKIEKTDFYGTKFYEKILSATEGELRLGFSEFETYGTYVGMNYPDAYMIRNWKSFRNISFYIDIADVNDDDLKWLAIDYDAASFEKYQETEPMLTELFKNKRYREKLTPEQFYTAVLESGAMGEYADGMIKVGNNYYPV